MAVKLGQILSDVAQIDNAVNRTQKMISEGRGLRAKTHKTALPVLFALTPSSSNPPIDKTIESANGHPIKQEFFDKIRPHVMIAL